MGGSTYIAWTTFISLPIIIPSDSYMPMIHSFDMYTTTSSQKIGLEIYCFDYVKYGDLRVSCRVRSPISDSSYVGYLGVSMVLYKKTAMADRYDGAYFMVH